MHRAPNATVAWLAAFLILAGAIHEMLPRAAGADDGIQSLPDIGGAVLALTNQQRTRAGLAPLERDPDLCRAAFEHSMRMLNLNFFSHNDPSGASPQSRIHSYARSFIGISGENIWSGTGYSSKAYADLAEKMVTGWMNSPEHRENILRREFTHLGVGVAVDGSEVRATQDFSSVRALLNVPLPDTIMEGRVISVRAHSTSRRNNPEMFDIVLAGTQHRVAGPFQLGWPTPVAVRRGLYQLRFYFPAGGQRYDIFDGPTLRVH